MKQVEGFKLRKIANENIIVAESIQHINFNKLISLNPSAAYLWESVTGKEFSVRDLADLLLAQYDVDEELALSDSQKIADAWKDAGIVEE